MAAKNGRTTIKLDPEVLAQAKQDAAAAGITLSAFIQARLLQGRSSSVARDSAEYVPLPSFSSGAPYELTPERIHEIQEEEDLEYARRFRSGGFGDSESQ